MVTDIRKVLKQVAAKRYVILDIEPFHAPGVTRVNLARVTDSEQMDYEAGFDFTDDLLAYISDEDLKEYLIEQIDRVHAGLPVQRIRVQLTQARRRW